MQRAVQQKRKDDGMKNSLSNKPSILKQQRGILIAFAVMFVFMCVVSENFFTVMNFNNLLKQIVTNGLLAFALTYCLIIGEIDLSVGSVIAFAGVFMVKLLQWGLNFPAALLVTFLAAALIGCITGALVACTKIPAFIVTLAMQNIIRGAAYLISGGIPIKAKNELFYSFGNGKILGIPNTVCVLILVIIVFSILLHRTIFGRHMYAIGGNRSAAVYAGIPVRRDVVVVYVLSAVLAILAGIMSASRIYQGQPTAGEGLECDAIAAAVLGGVSFNGGVGNAFGVVMGALVLGLMSNGLNLLGVSYYWQLLFKGILIIVAVFADVQKKDI